MMSATHFQMAQENVYLYIKYNIHYICRDTHTQSERQRQRYRETEMKDKVRIC